MSTPEPWLAQMATLPLPASLDPEKLGHFLREERGVEIPVFWFQGKGWLRLSVQGYNTDADMTALIQGVKDCQG